MAEVFCFIDVPIFKFYHNFISQFSCSARKIPKLTFFPIDKASQKVKIAENEGELLSLKEFE